MWLQHIKFTNTDAQTKGVLSYSLPLICTTSSTHLNTFQETPVILSDSEKKKKKEKKANLSLKCFNFAANGHFLVCSQSWLSRERIMRTLQIPGELTQGQMHRCREKWFFKFHTRKTPSEKVFKKDFCMYVNQSLNKTWNYNVECVTSDNRAFCIFISVTFLRYILYLFIYFYQMIVSWNILVKYNQKL